MSWVPTRHDKTNVLTFRKLTYRYYRIWLAPRADNMNQIAHCDWLPERARCSCSGLPAVSRMKYFPESHIINPLLTKFVRSRWDIGLVLFCEFMDLDFVSVHKHAKKRTWPISSHLDRTNLVNNPFILKYELLTSLNCGARLSVRNQTNLLEKRGSGELGDITRDNFN